MLAMDLHTPAIVTAYPKLSKVLLIKKIQVILNFLYILKYLAGIETVQFIESEYINIQAYQF